MTAQQMWAQFEMETGIRAEYDAWAFGETPDLLAELVLQGRKTATASSYPLYELEQEPLPQAGQYSVVLNSAREAVCIVQTTRVFIVPFCEVSPRQAYREGEGDRSLAYWRAVHRAFFTKELAAAGLTFRDDTKVVCEEFRMIYPKRSPLKLILPTKEYEEQVMTFREILLTRGEGFDGCSGLRQVESYEEWLDQKALMARIYGENCVPSTVYLAIRQEDRKLVGMIDLRHELSDFLLRYGGNIGYTVAPAERGKGRGKEMLRLLLDICRERGMEKVLVTCDKDNAASAGTICACGGVLENEVEDTVGSGTCGVIQRYWISLT